MESPSQDYTRIEQAIFYLDRRFPAHPSLEEVAAGVNLSPFHFQRMFTRWAGISPKRFLQFLTLDYAKQRLAESNSLLDVAYESGLSSPSRLHDLFVAVEAMTPGEFKKGGAGLQITYGFHPSPFGDCLLATTERGICWLSFLRNDSREAALEELRKEWPQAQFTENAASTASFADQIFGRVPHNGNLTVHLKGTNFQIKVWQALLQIPPGTLTSYEEVARRVGNPAATRAVGTAVGQNPVAFLIPCHRVIRKTGALGGYAGGLNRKRAMLAWEAARQNR